MKKYVLMTAAVMMTVAGFGAGARAEELSLAGSINQKLKVHMWIQIQGQRISGYYYYDKHSNDHLNLQGTRAAGNNITLTEYDTQGNVTGHFIGQLAPDRTFAGTWSTPDGKRSYRFQLAPERASAPSSNASTRTFTGTINRNLAIRMTLVFTLDSDQVHYVTITGSYYYVKNKGKITLRGYEEEGSVYLEEFDAKGRLTGTFDGYWTGDNSIEGTWIKPDGSKSYPFTLTEQ